jgi:hemerythrin-like domain-containing protein
MEFSEQLRKEHNTLKVMLSILETICEKLRMRKTIDLEALKKILEFFEEFVCKYHYGKEEDLYFLAIDEPGISKEVGPIRLMLEEHHKGRDYVKAFEVSLISYEKGGHQDGADVLSCARRCSSFLAIHIYKEENIVYPFIEQNVPYEKLQQIPVLLKNQELDKKFFKLLVDLNKDYLN